MKKYYYKKENLVIDESYFRKIGLVPTEKNLRKAGIYPLEVEEIDYDDKLETVEVNYIEKINDFYVQRMKAVEIKDENILQINLNKLIDEKYEQIAKEADSKIKPLLKNYSEEEIRTFYQQAKEATDWYENELNNSKRKTIKVVETPMIDKLSSVRGISKEKLIDKIIEKVKSFQNESIQIIGEKQVKRDLIKEIASNESISLRDRIIKIKAI